MKRSNEELLHAAIEAHKSGDLSSAKRLYQLVLHTNPAQFDARHNLGILEGQLGNLVSSLRLLRQTANANKKNKQYCKSYIHALLKLGLIDEAQSVLVGAQSSGWGAQEIMDMQDAIERKGALIAESKVMGAGPGAPEVERFLSSYGAGKTDEAKLLAASMAKRFPAHPLGWKALGVLEQRSGNLNVALSAMQKAPSLNLRDAEAFSNLGFCLKDIGWMEESALFCRQAIRLNPAYPDAHNNLGNALHFLGRLTEAQECFEEAIRLNPEFAEAYNNCGNVIKDLGFISEAQPFYREALRCKPSFLEAHSNLLFSLNYLETLRVDDALAEARRYGASASTRAVTKFVSWNVCFESADKLRIGFVSGDFKNHPVGYFIEGLIAHLDRGQFDVIAFPTDPRTDELTGRLTPLFDRWVPIYGQDDKTAARTIHQQGIHVLIDLSGHSAHNRLPVFAYKPAPCQMTWLGYFASTGLPEMDYFIGDPIMSPNDESHHFSEQIINLPKSWLCLLPQSCAVEVKPLPALVNGYVTFGSFSNLSKVGPKVIRLWSKVLQAVPKSKLFIKGKQLADRGMVLKLAQQFQMQGIDINRVTMEGPTSRRDYFVSFHGVDIVLDTFPYPGGTTSIDALWMGVPVLTLKGNSFLAHLGESIAFNAGLSDWIALDENEFVQKAKSFSESLERLAYLREELRGMLVQSPLFNIDEFAQGFGGLLWAAWQSSIKKYAGGRPNHEFGN